jgi:hypothetical protein
MCERERFEIPPVYDQPRVSHVSQADAGWALVMAGCIVGLVFGLGIGTTGVAQWILNTALVAATTGLAVSACAWWWAITK